MNRKYRVMTPEDEKLYKEWAKDKVKLLHEAKPDYILLTESSATPYGWVLKNAWKKMYPGEEIPKFYRTSIGHGVDVDPYYDPEVLPLYAKKRNLDKNKRLLIFDEMERKDHLNGPVYRVKEGITNPVEAKNATLNRNVRTFKAAGFKNILTFSSGFPFGEHVYGSKQNLEWIQDKEKRMGESYYIKPTSKNRDRPELGGKIEKNPVLRRRALDYIHDLKLIGKEAGQEVIEAQQRRKNLEQHLASIIFWGGFIGALLFLSSNITGNAIADLSVKTSSSLGIGLFAIALISGFFWLRNRKK